MDPLEAYKQKRAAIDAGLYKTRRDLSEELDAIYALADAVDEYNTKLVDGEKPVTHTEMAEQLADKGVWNYWSRRDP